MMTVVSIMIDWADAYGWKCPFCGADIDHAHEDRDEENDYADDSYYCQDHEGAMCANAYFMVRWSLTERGANGDAKTIARWIDIEIDKRYVTKREAQP